MKQKDALRKQKDNGLALREWLSDRATQAANLARSIREVRASEPKGKDRLPASMQGLEIRREYLIEHADANHAQRRKAGHTERVKGKRPKRVYRPGMNQVYYSPKRD